MQINTMFMVGLFVFNVGLFVAQWRNKKSTNEARLKYKMTALINHLQLPATALPPKVEALVASGERMTALRALRDERGLSLRQAVEQLDGGLEAQVDAVLAHFQVVVDTVPPQVHQLLAEGKKIQAIKAIRDATGASLKDAKSQVEAMVMRQA